MKRIWLLIAIVAGAGFFALGLSDDAYNVFSPPAFSLHIVLRKVESIAAFFVLGYAVDRAILEAGRKLRRGAGALSIAVYSAALEVAQFVHGSHEGLGWNAVDTICGGLGGAVADYAIYRQRRASARARAPKRRK